MPGLVLVAPMKAVLMPMSSPRRLTSAPPEISRVDGCVGLNEVLVFLDSDIRPMESADDPRGHRLADPIRIANGDGEIAHVQSVRIADRKCGQISAWILMTATSVPGSDPTRVAGA